MLELRSLLLPGAEPLALRGVIDRIDLDLAGRALVRDYKSGRPGRWRLAGRAVESAGPAGGSALHGRRRSELLGRTPVGGALPARCGGEKLAGARAWSARTSTPASPSSRPTAAPSAGSWRGEAGGGRRARLGQAGVGRVACAPGGSCRAPEPLQPRRRARCPGISPCGGPVSACAPFTSRAGAPRTSTIAAACSADRQRRLRQDLGDGRTEMRVRAVAR